jgi:stalled ribosome rescue protein Dom34
MIQTGVWLDKSTAYIITLSNNSKALKKISSNIDHFHVHGGSGTRFKGGPQDVVQDKKYLERENNQLALYFKDIASEIKNTEALVLFGPGDTNEKFSKNLHEKYPNISKKINGIKKTNSMTENQLKAWVFNFFKNQ